MNKIKEKDNRRGAETQRIDAKTLCVSAPLRLKNTQTEQIMNQTNKEKWVEDTLNTLNGIQRAQAPEGLLENAMRRAAFGRVRMVRMPTAQVWSAAACALVLVVANLFMCLDYSHSGKKASSSKEFFAKEYFGAFDAPQF